MKKFSKGEMIFIIYSIINLIIIWCAEKGVGILNGDISFGIIISWMMYMLSYIIYEFMNIGK